VCGGGSRAPSGVSPLITGTIEGGRGEIAGRGVRAALGLSVLAAAAAAAALLPLTLPASTL
jgi:hypothetical protein